MLSHLHLILLYALIPLNKRAFALFIGMYRVHDNVVMLREKEPTPREENNKRTDRKTLSAPRQFRNFDWEKSLGLVAFRIQCLN